MKSIAVLFVAALAAHAGVLPGIIGPWKQVSSSPLDAKTDRALWDELGLQDADHSVYRDKNATLAVDAWRLADSTAAMGAFEFMRPAVSETGASVQRSDAERGPDSGRGAHRGRATIWWRFTALFRNRMMRPTCSGRCPDMSMRGYHLSRATCRRVKRRILSATSAAQ